MKNRALLFHLLLELCKRMLLAKACLKGWLQATRESMLCLQPLCPPQRQVPSVHPTRLVSVDLASILVNLQDPRAEISTLPCNAFRTQLQLLGLQAASCPMRLVIQAVEALAPGRSVRSADLWSRQTMTTYSAWMAKGAGSMGYLNTCRLPHLYSHHVLPTV